jgi:hypothetical protein
VTRKDNRASPSGRAGRASHRAAARLDHTATIPDAIEIAGDRANLLNALYDAKLQLKYLDERWPTGTTPTTITRIEAAMNNALPWASIEAALKTRDDQ